MANELVFNEVVEQVSGHWVGLSAVALAVFHVQVSNSGQFIPKDPVKQRVALAKLFPTTGQESVVS